MVPIPTRCILLQILKLQLKMGKPVPDSAKEVVPPSTPSSVAAKSKKIIKTTMAGGATRVISTPKITFVGMSNDGPRWICVDFAWL